MKFAASLSLLLVGLTPAVDAQAGTATTTRYWDCSGGACGCAYLPPHLGGDHNAPSHCYSNAMFAAPAGNQHGATFYGAAAISEALGGGWWLAEGCGKCWKVTGKSNIADKPTGVETTLVLKGTNFCPPDNAACSGGKKHFDIAAPGFDWAGATLANTCSHVEPSELNAFRSCGNWMISSQDPDQNCECSLFSNSVLRDGCENFKSLNWNNPTVDFEEVTCPPELAALPCWADNGNTYPWPDAPALCMDPYPGSNPSPTNPAPAPTNPAPTNPAPAPTNPAPAPTSPTGGGNMCCTWDYTTCGESEWCNQKQDNCEGACGGTWEDPTSHVGSGGCCSWNDSTCGTDNYCNAQQSNCEGNCSGKWLSNGSAPAPTNPAPAPTNPAPAPTNPAPAPTNPAPAPTNPAPAPTNPAPAPTNPAPAPTNPSTSGCCSWNDSSCGSDTWCNTQQSNCEGNCNGKWLPNGSAPAPTNPAPAPTNPAPAPTNPAPAPTNPAPSPTNPVSGEVGELTWWTGSEPGPLSGSSCNYATADATKQSDSWLVPYVYPKMYCAVSEDLFANGVGCGKCFRLVYDGVGGTDPATAGSADIQVVNSGAGGEKHFDCFEDPFRALTGISTGVFPVSYTQIDCVDSPVTAVVLDGWNAYYVKVLIAGGKTGVVAVDITVGGATIAMNKVVGATWYANLSGAKNTNIKYDITFADGSTKTLKNCHGGSWPVANGAYCS